MKRIAYLDCLRGLAMLMVVYGHTVGFALKLSDVGTLGWLISSFCFIQLQLFFFVSGYFAPPSPIFNYRHIRSRLLYLMLPTVVTFLVYVLFRDKSLEHLDIYLSDEYKFGYWFPFVLFEMNIIHYFLSLILSNTKRFLLIMAAVCAILILLKDWDWYHNGTFLCRWFSLRLVASYLPFYLLGIIVAQYCNVVNRYANSHIVYGIALAGFALSFIIPMSGFYSSMLKALLGLTVVFCLFYRHQQHVSETFIGRQLMLIGRYTLPIYLIHYFLLPGMNIPWLQHIGPSFGWLTTMICLATTCMIVYLSMSIAYVMSHSRVLHLLFLGKIAKISDK